MVPGMAPMAPGMQPMAQGMPQGYAMPTMMPGMQPMAHGMPQGYAMSGGAQGSGDHHEQPSPKRRKRQATQEEQEGEYPNTRNGPALGLPPPPKFHDDLQKLSTSYKALGLAHVHKKERVTTSAFRASLIVAANSELWPQFTLSQLSSEYIDLLLFLVTGVLPSTRTAELGCQTKGKARMMSRRQYEFRLSKGKGKLTEIADDFSNLPQLCLREGYPIGLMSKDLRGLIGGGNQSAGATDTPITSGDVQQVHFAHALTHRAMGTEEPNKNAKKTKRRAILDKPVSESGSAGSVVTTVPPASSSGSVHHVSGDSSSDSESTPNLPPLAAQSAAVAPNAAAGCGSATPPPSAAVKVNVPKLVIPGAKRQAVQSVASKRAMGKLPDDELEDPLSTP